MSDGKKRRVHSAEFRAKVGLEAVRGVKTINEIAQEHDVHPQLVTRWKKEILENAGALFDVKRGPKPVDESSPEDKLYSEIGKLKMHPFSQTMEPQQNPWRFSMAMRCLRLTMPDQTLFAYSLTKPDALRCFDCCH
jgi:transposase-like protein